LKVIFGDLLHRHIERWFFIEKGSQSKNYDFIDRDMKIENEQTEMFRLLWDDFTDGYERFYLTVNPMTPAMTNMDFTMVMNEALSMTMFRTFGYRWKNKCRLPKMLLMPEGHSSKTNGNTLLHYHGVFNIKSDRVAQKIQMCLPSNFQKKVFDCRMKQKKRYQFEMPYIRFSNWDSSKDAIGYTLKQHGYGYDTNDCYVWGKERG